MIDIVSVGSDIGVFDSQAPQAANILSVQLGSLVYEPTFGIDLKYFLDEDFIFQNESFKAYLVERLANYGVNVTSINDTVANLFRQYQFNIKPTQAEGGLVAR